MLWLCCCFPLPCLSLSVPCKLFFFFFFKRSFLRAQKAKVSVSSSCPPRYPFQERKLAPAQRSECGLRSFRSTQKVNGGEFRRPFSLSLRVPGGSLCLVVLVHVLLYIVWAHVTCSKENFTYSVFVSPSSCPATGPVLLFVFSPHRHIIISGGGPPSLVPIARFHLHFLNQKKNTSPSRDVSL